MDSVRDLLFEEKIRKWGKLNEESNTLKKPSFKGNEFRNSRCRGKQGKLCN